MRKFICLAVLAVSACTTKPLGQSVPTQSGHNMHSARAALGDCVAEAPEGRNAAVIGGYATNILLWGVIIGPAVTAPVQDQLAEQGEIDQVERCMSDRGFKRRTLTQGEQFWLQNAFGTERTRRLDHLVGGGTIETYGT
ncbi:hypothetical protein [Ruegeria sp.]|uniref:hypothetical protein n=1 Tax=Ruegeria sp. TaxID=1879320 RepID=UPI00231EA4E3|nr:hypothetical protein [Ruegeria sp.]MDA7964794.1 hypothetical protein [Ruegeria sp.]